jgi:hypothetical protein
MKPVMNNLDKNINDVDNEDICYNKQKYELEQLSKSQIHTIEYAINKGTIESTIKTNNLFYPDLDRIQGRFNDGISKDNLYKEFGNPYIVCLKDSAKYESFFYDQIISADQLNTMIDSIEIIPTTYKAINGTAFKYLTSFSAGIFKKNFVVLDKYGMKVEPAKDVLICSLLRFNKTNIIRYLKQFDGISNFIDLYNSLLINEYLGQTNKTSTTKQNHIHIINSMHESNYYTNHNNCQLNITLKFKSRGFNLALSDRLTDQTVQKVLQRLAESKEEDNNYLAFLFRKSAYLDASSAVNASGYKLYRIANNPIIDTMKADNFNALYDKLSHTEKYYLIMNSMISKDLCHFVVNNKYILNDIMSDTKDPNGHTFMNKYGQLIRYTLGYAWLTLYMEESIKRGYINTSDRFIFDIETASKLPYYPYSINNLHICPYLPILVDTETMNAEKNVLGVQQYRFDPEPIGNLNKLTRYGVTDRKTFIDRVNMFMSGKTNTNILKNINWSHIAMSGSMMACCLPNFNTLMSNFFTQNKEIDFLAYTNEYYKEADIDIMCNIPDIYEFVDKIYEFKNTIENNIKEIHNLTTESPNITSVFSNKSAAIMINKYFIKVHLQKETGLDYIDILSNVNAPVVKEAVHKHYLSWYKTNLAESLKSNPEKFMDDKYHELYLPVPIENCNVIFIKTQIDKKEDEADEKKKIIEDIRNDDNIQLEEDDKDYDEEEKQYEESPNTTDEYPADNVVFIPKVNFKFRISSSYLPHNLELFQIKHQEFFSTVARFHLPIVRSYYDGTNIFITPSCISACMTMLNIDYKYFAGSKDPIEIINKYRMRGFGTILNDREIVRLLEYSNLVPKWKQLYSLNIQSNGSIMKILGQLDINNSLFNPLKILDNKDRSTEYKNIRTFNYTIIPHNISEIISIIKRMYKTSSVGEQFNLSNITTINKYGYVEPVKKWLIDAFYDFNFNRMDNNIT